MKHCSRCRTPYTDASLNFCTKDGAELIDGPPPGFDSQPDTLILPSSAPTSQGEGAKVRAMVNMEINANLTALRNFWTEAESRGSGFKHSPIGHAQMLDGIRDQELPNFKQDVWNSLLPQIPNALSTAEITKVYQFHAQLDNLKALKSKIDRSKHKMDREREIEKLITEILAAGNPLQD